MNSNSHFQQRKFLYLIFHCFPIGFLGTIEEEWDYWFKDPKSLDYQSKIPNGSHRKFHKKPIQAQ